VLAAGQGKRMRSEKPKVLHDILGKTILWRVLDTLDQLDLEHIHVVIGHGAQAVRAYLDDCSWHTPISIHLQEPQLGTGHAVLQVEEALKGFDGTLLVTYGDTPLLTGETLTKLLDVHLSEKADVSLITTVVEDPKGYGRILRSAKGAIVGIVENKDASSEQKQIKEINPGIYCLRFPRVLSGLRNLSNKNEQGEYYLTDLVGWAVENKMKLAGLGVPDWQELAGINSRVDLADAGRILNQRNLSKLALESGVTVVDPASTWIAPEVKIEQDSLILPNCWLVGDITIGRACTIGPGATIKGLVDIGSGSQIVHSHLEDCQVGNDCRIGPFAHLRAGTVLSDEVRVGNFVEVKKSFLGLAAKASHLSYIGDTTIGNDANIGAGTIVANYDHITKVKSRTTIGDRASTGSNSVIVAPVSLGDGCFVAAGTVVTKNVPPGALAVGRAPQVHKEGWCESRKRKHTEGRAENKAQKVEKPGK
jgi:bifunctional UDP-N-acetylglucosamine pyrophosphorylase/glucosamine-1-phosphate N-acetyltransferase